MENVSVTSRQELRQEVVAGDHLLVSDASRDLGGRDEGPQPFQLLLAALGSCTSMTIRMYAERKGWRLRDIKVDLEHEREKVRDSGHGVRVVDRVRKRIYLSGDLSEEQVKRLAYVAERCPVNQALHGGVEMVSTVQRA